VPDKPTTAAGYRREHVELVRDTCLYVPTKLADLSDDVVVVGGLVPSLLIAQDALPVGVEPHVGTMDLDIGLTLAVLDEARYRTLTERFDVRASAQSLTIRETRRANAGRSKTTRR